MSLYEVPVIPNNLRNEETIVQIADALNYLCDVFDDIIWKVNTRVEVNKQRLTGLTQRINESSEKITRLTGTKKATQVFSSSKYPATDSHKRYKSIFASDTPKTVTFSRTKKKYKDPVLTEYPLEKLQFYHVKVSDKFKRSTNYMEEGLGSFPTDIESINELLLFNTSKNPYKNYDISDPLQASQYTKEIDDTSTPGPDAAPLSISQRTGLNRTVGENYFYTPGLGDVPTIDVPLDLPDLPGVADDLRYLMESGPGIAPSVTTTPIVPDLPSIVQSPNDIPVPDISSVLANEVLPPLPPAVPDFDLPLVESNEIEDKQIESAHVSMTAPIPLPVPMPEVIAVPEVVKKVEVKSKKEKIPDVPDARASLMAAIRQAGGAKKANLRNTEPKKDEESTSSVSDIL